MQVLVFILLKLKAYLFNSFPCIGLQSKLKILQQSATARKPLVFVAVSDVQQQLKILKS